MGNGRSVGDTGRAWANIWYSRLLLACPSRAVPDIRVYWLPIRPTMLSHLGWAGSAGGLSGLKAMARTAGGADEEGRLDGGVGQPGDPLVGL